MAALFAGISLAFLRASGARGPGLTAAAIVLLGGSYFLVFPGYDKFGPLLVGVSLTALGVAHLAQPARGVWLLALGVTVGILSHRTGFLLLPAAMVAYLTAFRASRDRIRRRHIVAAAAAATFGAALMLPRTLQLLLGLDVRLQGASFASAIPSGVEGGGWLLHLSDAVNTLFFLVPLWPVGLVAAWYLRRSAKSGHEPPGALPLGPIALVAVVPSILLLVATRAPQGAARDWDIYVGAGVTVALVVAFLLARLGARAATPRLWSGLATLSLALALGHWMVWGHEPSQLRRIEGLLDAEPRWNAEQRARTYDFLGGWAFRTGRYSDAARYMNGAVEAAPNPRYIYQAGLAHWRAGQLEAARRQALRAIRVAPENAYPWWILSVVARASGETTAAAAYEDSARARGSARPPEGL